MRRVLPLLPLLILTLFATAAPASAQTGPCTKAASLGLIESDDHDHNEVAQHKGLSCNFEKADFLPLVKELEGHENSKLGEMDVKGDVLGVAIQEPIGGALFFDVKDPAKPKFLGRYLHATCGLGDNCGAFIDMTADGKYAVLAVQQTDLMPGLIGGTAGQAPGVALINLTDPAKPTLAQEYATVSFQGVHTARTHVIDGVEYVALIQNAVGVEIARIVETPGGRRMVRVANIPTPDRQNIANTHDTFWSTDPIDKKPYLYLAGGFTFGFQAYDMSNPVRPVKVAEWDPTPKCVNDWYAHTIDVAVRNGRRFLTMPAEQFSFGAQSSAGGEKCGEVSGNGDMPGTMWILDITDFAKPDLVSTWRTPGDRAAGQLTFSAHNQQIVGDQIYLSHYHGGVYVLDAAKVFAGARERPTEVGWVLPHDEQVRPTLESGTFPHSRQDFWDVVHHKGIALAADIKGGLHAMRWTGTGAPSGGGGGDGGPVTCLALPSTRTVFALSRRGARVRGQASACGELKRVLVAVGLKKGRKCRWMNSRGVLGRPGSCARPKFVAARGTSKFSLRTRKRLPKGRYRVASRAIDGNGGVEPLRLRTVRVR